MFTLHSIELHLIYHYLSLHDKLFLARCSTRLYEAGQHPFAWMHSGNEHITCSKGCSRHTILPVPLPYQAIALSRLTRNARAVKMHMSDDATLTVLTRFTHLTTLDLSMITHLTAARLHPVFTALSPTLTHLELDILAERDGQLLSRELAILTHLTTLSLRSYDVLKDFSFLLEMPLLRVLELDPAPSRHNEPLPLTNALLAILPTMPCLQALTVGKRSDCDGFLHPLSIADMEKWVEVHVAHAACTAATIPLQKMCIRHIPSPDDFEYEYVVDESGKKHLFERADKLDRLLVGLFHFTSLTHLHLSYTRHTELRRLLLHIFTHSIPVHVTHLQVTVSGWTPFGNNGDDKLADGLTHLLQPFLPTNTPVRSHYLLAAWFNNTTLLPGLESVDVKYWFAVPLSEDAHMHVQSLIPTQHRQSGIRTLKCVEVSQYRKQELVWMHPIVFLLNFKQLVLSCKHHWNMYESSDVRYSGMDELVDVLSLHTPTHAPSSHSAPIATPHDHPSLVLKLLTRTVIRDSLMLQLSSIKQQMEANGHSLQVVDEDGLNMLIRYARVRATQREGAPYW